MDSEAAAAEKRLRKLNEAAAPEISPLSAGTRKQVQSAQKPLLLEDPISRGSATRQGRWPEGYPMKTRVELLVSALENEGVTRIFGVYRIAQRTPLMNRQQNGAVIPTRESSSARMRYSE
jgi:hypothetical protein